MKKQKLWKWQNNMVWLRNNKVLKLNEMHIMKRWYKLSLHFFSLIYMRLNKNINDIHLKGSIIGQILHFDSIKEE